MGKKSSSYEYSLLAEEDRYMMSINDDFTEKDVQPAKVSRLQTVMSICTTMCGTTIVALPSGLADAGLGAGLSIIVLLSAVSCYTCLLIMRTGMDEFSVTVRAILGPKIQYLASFMSIAVVIGAAIVYHILMQETIYDMGVTIMTAANKYSSGWSRYVAALIPWVVYPIATRQDLSVIIKINSVGFIFLLFVLVFILYHGIDALVENNGFDLIATAEPGASPFAPDGTLHIIYGGTLNFASLGGMMMLSYFIHNCIQSLVKDSDPRTRNTDIVIAYVIATLIYSSVGVLGYFGFATAYSKSQCAFLAGAASDVPVAGASSAISHFWNYPIRQLGADVVATAIDTVNSISGGNVQASSPCTLSSNFLMIFGTNFENSANIYAFTARLSLLLQLFTVFPILLMVIRVQTFELIFKKSWPGWWHTATINFIIMGVTFAFAATNQQISSVMRFVGAIGGFAIMFAVPVFMDFVMRSKEGTISVIGTIFNIISFLVAAFFFILQFIPKL